MPRIIGEPKRLLSGYKLVLDLEDLNLMDFSVQYFDRLIAFLSEPSLHNSQDLFRLLQMVEDHLTFGGTIYGLIGISRGSYICASVDGKTIAFQVVPYPKIDLSKLDLISKNRQLARQYATARRFAEHLLSNNPIN